MKTHFAVQDLVFSYGEKPILSGVSLSLRRGEIVSLLGPNGTGKSTLMRLMLGLLKPQQGTITLDGRPILSLTAKERAKYIAYVPQSTRIAFAFSGVDVVLMGRVNHQSFFASPSRRDRSVAYAAMERLGISHLAEQPYPTMSGGEKQLLMIARALTQEAPILVMDEPVSGLDYGNQLRLLETITSLTSEGYTFLKSTHFPEHAVQVGGRVIALKDGDMIADGPAHTTVNPELIKTLYDTDVTMHHVGEKYPVYVPSFYTGNTTDSLYKGIQ